MPTHTLHINETVGEKETKAILAMAEAVKALEQQLADAKRRIKDLEDLLKNA
jgi:hypothetical protein